MAWIFRRGIDLGILFAINQSISLYISHLSCTDSLKKVIAFLKNETCPISLAQEPRKNIAHCEYLFEEFEERKRAEKEKALKYVDKIIDKKFVKSRVFYLVKWQDRRPDEWLSRVDLLAFHPDKISEYESKYGLVGKRRFKEREFDHENGCYNDDSQDEQNSSRSQSHSSSSVSSRSSRSQSSKSSRSGSSDSHHSSSNNSEDSRNNSQSSRSRSNSNSSSSNSSNSKEKDEQQQLQDVSPRSKPRKKSDEKKQSHEKQEKESEDNSRNQSNPASSHNRSIVKALRKDGKVSSKKNAAEPVVEYGRLPQHGIFGIDEPRQLRNMIIDKAVGHPSDAFFACDLAWKPRPNDWTPLESRVSRLDVKMFYPLLLIEFYESNLTYSGEVENAEGDHDDDDDDNDNDQRHFKNYNDNGNTNFNNNNNRLYDQFNTPIPVGYAKAMIDSKKSVRFGDFHKNSNSAMEELN